MSRLSLPWFLGAVLLPALFTALPAAAQITLPGQEAKKKEDTEPEKPKVDPRLATMLANPRTTMRNFLELVNDDRKDEAAKCLDLSKLDAATVEAKGAGYVLRLKETLDRMERVELARIPDDPAYEQPYVFGHDTDGLSGTDLDDAKQIVISRGDDGLWRFSAATVESIEDLWNRWKGREVVKGLAESKATRTLEMWLEDQFPAALNQTHFLLKDYQWICLLLLIFLGFIADLTVRSVLYFITHAWFRYIKSEEGQKIERKLWKPVGLLVQALIWYGGTTLLGLPDVVMMILLAGLKLFAVVAAVWTAFMLINLLSGYLAKKASGTDTKFDDLLVPLISKSLKVFAVCVGLLTCAQAFNLPIAGLVGGLGLGGMALALASKDAVSNLFGSVTVLVDRPFEVGDWVVTDGVEGSVESVGFRSTRIRTFYNSLITVPNSRLTTATVDNMGRRRFRRVKTMLGLQYDTEPEQIDAFCEGIRELLRRHPYTRKDYYHVYFNAFSDSSLDVLLYCFLDCPDWSVELREKHQLYLDIVRLAKRLGVSFAFPTRTLHMFQEQHDDQAPPLDLSDSTRAGQRLGAEIAGPCLPPAERPGSVQFTGPTPLGPDDHDDGEGGSNE